jgi:hypothetical protein
MGPNTPHMSGGMKIFRRWPPAMLDAQINPGGSLCAEQY